MQGRLTEQEAEALAAEVKPQLMEMSKGIMTTASLIMMVGLVLEYLEERDANTTRE